MFYARGGNGDFLPLGIWQDLLLPFLLPKCPVNDTARCQLMNKLTYDKHSVELTEASEIVEYTPADTNMIDTELPTETILGESIKHVRLIANPLQRTKLPDNLERFPICIALFGRSYTGKVTQARKIAERYSLVCICVYDEIQRTLNSDDNEFKNEVLSSLEIGQELPNSVSVQLIIDRIKQLSNETQRPKGWILGDFPSNLDQAMLLEKSLTNFVAENTQPTIDDMASSVTPSLLVGQPPLQGLSGLNLILHISKSRLELTRNCLGNLQDPLDATQEFHMMYNPPPESSTFKHRLENVHPKNYSRHDLAKQIAFWDLNFSSTINWYQEICEVVKIDGSHVSEDQLLSRCIREIDSFFSEKQALQDVKDEEMRQKQHDINQDIASHESRLLACEEAISVAEQAEQDATTALAEGETNKLKKDELKALRETLESANAAVIEKKSDLDNVKKARELDIIERNKSPLVIPPAIAGPLSKRWNFEETCYIDRLYEGFQASRAYRTEIVLYCRQVIEDFGLLLRQPDSKQHHLMQFLIEFNNIPSDVRYASSTMDELHYRTVELGRNLWEVLDKKMITYLEEVEKTQNAGWSMQYVNKYINYSLHIVQAECDRFFGSIWLLYDVACGLCQEECCSLLVVSEESLLKPIDVAAFTSEEVSSKTKGAASNTFGKENESKEYPELFRGLTAAIDFSKTLANAFVDKLEKENAERTKNSISAIRHEVKKFEARIVKLLEQVLSCCDEVKRWEESMAISMGEAVGHRKTVEGQAIELVLIRIREAIEQKTHLPHLINMEVIKFVVYYR